MIINLLSKQNTKYYLIANTLRIINIQKCVKYMQLLNVF